jgi:hypothetical protein
LLLRAARPGCPAGPRHPAGKGDSVRKRNHLGAVSMPGRSPAAATPGGSKQPSQGPRHWMILRYDLATAVLLLSTLLTSTISPGQAARTPAGWQLVDPWPSAEATMGIRSQPVTFPSSSPFTPRDVPRAEPTTAVATLYLPPTSALTHSEGADERPWFAPRRDAKAEGRDTAWCMIALRRPHRGANQALRRELPHPRCPLGLW